MLILWAATKHTIALCCSSDAKEIRFLLNEFIDYYRKYTSNGILTYLISIFFLNAKFLSLLFFVKTSLFFGKIYGLLIL